MTPGQDIAHRIPVPREGLVVREPNLVQSLEVQAVFRAYFVTDPHRRGAAGCPGSSVNCGLVRT